MDYLSSLLLQGSQQKQKKRAFISFDYDHNEDLKNALNAQSKNPDSPFFFEDWSVKEPFPQSTWKEDVRNKIKKCDFVIVVIGTYTYNASGVKTEIAIANEEYIPCFGIYDKNIPYFKDGQYWVNVPDGLGRRHFYWTWPEITTAINNINNYYPPKTNIYG